MKQDYPRRALSHNSHPTDDWIMSMFEDWFDPCPLNPNFDPMKDIDGLKINWAKKTYVNPPYSDPMPWVRKAVKEAATGSRVALLLKHDTSTSWFKLLHQANAHILLVGERLRYGSNTPAAFPSALFILDPANPPHQYNITEVQTNGENE